jgi:dihydropteroate synthase
VIKHNLKLVNIKNLNDAEKEIKKIGSDPKSIEIMAPKTIVKVIKVKNVKLQDAIIIKQDMLSIGGEVAVPKYTFDLYDKSADILIIGNLNQLKELINKLNRHYSRIKDIANEISIFLKDVQ